MRYSKLYNILVIIALLQGVSFGFDLPPIIYNFVMLLGLIVILKRKLEHFSVLFVIFLLMALAGILLNNIPTFFSSELRLMSFVVVSSFVGPLFISMHATNFRLAMFVFINRVIVVLASTSFLLFVVGIALPRSATGPNSGFFNHSLMLGPFAAVAVLLLLYVLLIKDQKYNSRRKWLIAFLILSFLSLLISSSRTSIIGLLLALPILLYKINYNKITRAFRLILLSLVLMGITQPLWSEYAEGILAKNEKNVDGDLLSSRKLHWDARVYEFTSSPIIGIGFAAADVHSLNAIGFDKETGVVESGSSWLSLLSMTGVLGFFCVALIFLRSGLFLFRDKSSYALSGILCSLLVFFAVHMNAEGYILASGSLLFFYVWLLLGVIEGYKRYGVFTII
jgi:hypothetical protein